MHTNLLFYFLLYSFLGWCLESIYKTILEKKIINSGFLYGPFCPIYGFGAIIMILILQRLSNNIICIFIIGMIILTIWEYLVGVILEKIFKTKYWDYSDKKFNIHGRICLKNSIYWGVLGAVFTMIIHPFVIDKLAKLPTNIIMYTTIMLYMIIFVDATTTITRILFIDKKIQRLSEISDTIKEKIQELKKSDKRENRYEENVQKMIIQLKKEQTRIKTKLYKLAKRLKEAFPSMQSETINNFIVQKKEDIQLIKERIKKKNKEN